MTALPATEHERRQNVARKRAALLGLRADDPLYERAVELGMTMRAWQIAQVCGCSRESIIALGGPHHD